MDTLQMSILGSNAEFTCLQQVSPCIDLTDTPLPGSLPGPLITNPNVYVTSSVSQHFYSEIQFDLANNFWGVDFQFGNNASGIEIRQGIAHLIDKSAFTANDPNIAGVSLPLDNPMPSDNGGLLSPNPCVWDSSFVETGSNCAVGKLGGTSYHLAAATGVNYPWQPALGSADFCAASQHFINAGLASGKDSTTCVLKGVSPAVTTHTVNIFVRSDSPPRLDLGRSLAQVICALFGQGFVNGCSPYLTETEAPITGFPGFFPCTSSTICNLGTFGMYTGAFDDVFPFDASLYFIYNSRFVSGSPSVQPPNGPCSSQAVPSSSPANYMFLCNTNYDSLTNQMEFAPYLSLPGCDPVVGSTSNSPPVACTGQLSAISAGVEAQDQFGKGAYTIPIYTSTARFGYLSNWQRVINGDGVGIPNYFTWLNAYSPNAALPGTIRQGFAQTTRSVNPYVATTLWDSYMVGNIYDSLTVTNPLNAAQQIDWMGYLNTNPLPPIALTYTPPAGTVSTFRFTLRSDIFFQDGRKVTAFDVAFSYLSLKATGAFAGGGAAPMIGITILGATQFDIGVNAVGPFTLQSLFGLPILPGAYWTNAGSSAWNGGINACTSTGATCYPAQYSLSTSSGPVTCALACTSFPAAMMTVNPADTVPSFDPIQSHVFVGSGPWKCGTVTSVGSGTCSSSGTENPPLGGSYSISRFGTGLSPGSSVSGIYFRSNGNLALWTWSEDDGDITHDFLTFSIVASCFGQPASGSSNCLHWEMGIGGCGGSPTSPCQIGLGQISIVNRFVGLNWVAPFNWQTAPPTGISGFAPILYEDGFILNPASVAGCLQAFPVGGYDC